MTMDEQSRPPALERLLRAPRSERRAVLEDLVSQEFKRALLMTERDVLPVDENYFELGLTSLRAAEVKERIEEQLQCELDTSLLFGLATVRQVVDHLASVVLPGAAATPPPRESASARSAELHQRVNDLIADLYDT